jgi:hypothetical protein
VANNHTLIVGGEGRLLEALSDTTGVAKIYGSDDQGRSWRELGSVAGKRLGEAALAHVGGGRIVFISRHEWPFYRLSFSSDNGVTWDKTAAVLPLGGGDNPPKLVDARWQDSGGRRSFLVSRQESERSPPTRFLDQSRRRPNLGQLSADRLCPRRRRRLPATFPDVRR